MAQRRKAAGSETAPPRATTNAAVLDAAMAGTAGTVAGALALGIAQTDDARADAVRETMAAIRPAGEAESDAVDAVTADPAPMRAIDAVSRTAEAAATQATPPQDAEAGRAAGDAETPAAAPRSEHTAGTAAKTETSPEADAAPPAMPGGAGGAHAGSSLDAEVIADRISEQISSAVERIALGIENGTSMEMSRTIAQEIAETTVGIVRDIEAALPTASLGEDIRATAESALSVEALADEVAASLEAMPIADLADDVSASVEDAIAGAGLATMQVPATSGDLLGLLPSALLGGESAGPDGGLLSTLFYSDGEAGSSPPGAATATAPILAEPVQWAREAGTVDAADSLSHAATGMDGLETLTIDLVGISYTDAGDLPYAGMQSGLGALHLV